MAVDTWKWCMLKYEGGSWKGQSERGSQDSEARSWVKGVVQMLQGQGQGGQCWWTSCSCSCSCYLGQEGGWANQA